MDTGKNLDFEKESVNLTLAGRDRQRVEHLDTGKPITCAQENGG